MIESGRIRDAYNEIAERYANRRDQTSTIPYLEKLQERLSGPSNILDLGCGAGLPIDLWLAQQGHRVTGVDISEKMLDLARRNVPEANFRIGDLTDLAPGEFSVDAVVCVFAMIHIDRSRHREFLSRVHSFLPENGSVLITTGRDNWEGTEEFLGADMVWSHFDRATNRSLIESVGFEILVEDEHRGNSFGDDDWHPIFLARALAR